MLQAETFPHVFTPVRVSMRAYARRRVIIFVLLSGMPFGWSAAELPAEGSAIQKLPSPTDHYADFVTEAAERFDIPATWIRAVLRAESDGDARSTSPKGAMGLMQIMPQTWAELRIRYGLGENPYDPHDNIMAGAAYLRELFDRYGNPGFLAAYNAGPGRYEASRKGRPLPPETRAYVDKLAPDIAHGKAEPAASLPLGTTTVETPFWAQSPIFAVKPIRPSAADPAPPDRAQLAPDVRDVSAITPQPAALFVARGSVGGGR